MATNENAQTEDSQTQANQVDQKNPYLEYLKKNEEKVAQALQEKINNLIKSDQKKKIAILEKSVTDSEAELDRLKKLVNEYYFHEMNNNSSKGEKLEKLNEELKKVGESYKIKNDGSGKKDELEINEKAFGTSLDTLKDDMSDKSKKPDEVLKKFMEDNKQQFAKLKLEKDMNNFNTNISNLIKQMESKQK